MTSLHVHGKHLFRIYPKDVEQLFELMEKDFIDRLTEIIVGRNIFKLKNINNNSLKLSIEGLSHRVLQIMNLLLQKYNLEERKPQIHMKINTTFSTGCDITPLLFKHSKELHIDNYSSAPHKLTASGEFPHCPILTDLTFEGMHIDKSVSIFLKRATLNGKLPRLRSITLIECCKNSSCLDWPSKVKVSREIISAICEECEKMKKMVKLFS